MTYCANSVRRSPGTTALLLLLVLPMTAIGCAAPAPNTSSAPPSAADPAVTPDPAHRYPGDVVDLRDWYLTLPTGTPEDPDTVHQPALATYSGPYFRLDDARTGVVFTANAGGATTKGSGYPRSELREMAGSEKAAWSNRSGTHTLTVRGAVTVLPPVKPEVVVAQIHDAEDDVVLVRVEKDRLLVEWDNGDREVVLDPAYRLGTAYELRIVAANGRVEIFHDGVRKAEIPKVGSGWYFKAGSYLQSNVERGDAPDAVGAVVVDAVQVEHRPGNR